MLLRSDYISKWFETGNNHNVMSFVYQQICQYADNVLRQNCKWTALWQQRMAGAKKNCKKFPQKQLSVNYQQTRDSLCIMQMKSPKHRQLCQSTIASNTHFCNGRRNEQFSSDWVTAVEILLVYVFHYCCNSQCIYCMSEQLNGYISIPCYSDMAQHITAVTSHFCAELYTLVNYHQKIPDY